MKRLIIFISACLLLFVHSFAEVNTASVDSVTYNKDKSITVFGTVSGEAEEFGISISFDEKSEDFRNALHFKAYGGANGEGKFGVNIPYSEFAADGVFALKTYVANKDGSMVYSDNALTVDTVGQYSRIPKLRAVYPSEGEIYPALSEDVSEYYILVDKIPENPLSIKYEKENDEDSVIYTEASGISDSVKIKLSSGYKEKTYSFSYRIRKKAKLSPSKYFSKAEGQLVSSSGGIVSGNGTVNYITLDTSGIPEKYVPSKLVCSLKGTVGKSVSIAACTEPFIDTKNWADVSPEYSPQTGVLKNLTLGEAETRVVMDETEFSTRTSLKLAVKADDGANVSGLFAELEYFENFAVPSADAGSSEPCAISVSVAGANEIYPEFKPDIYEYYAVFDSLPTTIPKVTFVAGNPASEIKLTPAADINGETVAEISLNGKTKTYKIKFREYREASLKLSNLQGKRTPYELFNMKIPCTSTTPYHSYVGRIENEFGTSHSHLVTMAFDTSDIQEEDIHISAAELNLLATTNCRSGMYVDFYRCTNTSWTNTDYGKYFFATANHLVNRGAEGKLNGDTLIEYTGGKNNPGDYRYYTFSLNTSGFTNAESINLYLLPRWQSVNPPNATYQNAYVWMGKNGAETQDGIGMLPTVYVKYFEK